MGLITLTRDSWLTEISWEEPDATSGTFADVYAWYVTLTRIFNRTVSLFLPLLMQG